MMKYYSQVIMLVFICFCVPISWANDDVVDFDWQGLDKEKISLEKPLLIVKGSKGFLACAYIDINACNSTGAACAIVSGVNTHKEMLAAKVLFVSDKARLLGAKKGMSGSEMIELIR